MEHYEIPLGMSLLNHCVLHAWADDEPIAGGERPESPHASVIDHSA